MQYECVSVVFDVVEDFVKFLFEICDVLFEDGFVLFSCFGVFTTVCAKPVGVKLFTVCRICVGRDVRIILVEEFVLVFDGMGDFVSGV